MRNDSRRHFVGSLGALFLAPVLAACGAAKTRPFAVATHVWPGYETLFLARQRGWLSEKQVRLVETPSATSTLQALGSGIVDGAALTLDEVLRARANGMDLGVVLVFDVSAGADMVLGRPTLKTLGDLKGCTIGVEQGGLGGVVLVHALQAGGLSDRDVHQVALAPVDQLAAWQNGQLDAVVTYEPTAGKLLAAGARRLYDSRQMPQMIVDVLAIRSAMLTQRPEAIRHLASAHFRALDFLRNNFQDAANLMAPRLRLQTELVRTAFSGLELPDLVANRRLLAGTDAQLLRSARKLSGSMFKVGLLPREDTLTALLHGDFLPPEGS